ncbi:Peptidoglycan D,D-transpeptidase MrdA [Ralstonia condita]|uniref:Peptidoglycan D,D-transpeptidase MrdA n=1 Tax=Ralstonia condita TaxID=3058600 RepID=A0ABN9IWJ2_9RALS|nr:penicillin-binding protein 2 [Ralstonia sp. LMG 7141]CAJ0791383.1 Peptidoglycan D,D-transpeptidase MrdA [Ralstonia sp. LMG 7141]
MTEIRNVEQELSRFRLRLAAAALFVLVCFGLLLARFFWLQSIKHEQYSAKAEDNRISVAPIEPNRGIIMDRNGVVLARNYSAYTLEITPSKLQDTLDNTIDQLAQLVDIQPRDRRRFKRLMEDARSFESLPIRSQLTDQEVARFSAQRFRFPGVDVHARLFRQYPLGESASHVIGYIGRISERDLERIDDMSDANSQPGVTYDPRKDSNNYSGTEYIGKVGIEQSYETELHGLTGYEEVEVSAGGRPIRTLSTSQATPGNNLILSLDINLQRLAEQLFGNRRGALVAIEPETGDILAFVSKPTFDPNLFIEGIDSATWNELNNSPDKPLLNRPLRGTYPPGSTYKPFMALGALELGKRTPQWGMADPGSFTLGNHTFRDDVPGGHGWVDMFRSIVMSCDTYYYRLANDMGVNAIHDFMKPFGFGQITGIDIEGERTGILPSTDWKRRAYKRPEQQKWYDGETISLGIGQGYNNFTILQLAHAVSTLANNGVVMKPHLVKAVEDSVSKSRALTVPTESYRIPLKQSNIDVIKHAMVGVNQTGTAAKAFIGAQYVSAGKTGTAQVYSLGKNEKYNHHAIPENKRDHALFEAFAPADHPKIALALIVENAGFGAASAAPIARAVMDYYLTGKWPAELAATAPKPQPQPPVDTPSVFSTGKTATIASATAAPQAAAEVASGVVAASGVAAPASSAVAAASAPAASSVATGATRSAPPLSPDLVAPALREAGTSAEAVAPATLDAQVLQALSHAQPAPELTPRGRGSAAAPAPAPATTPKGAKDAKPGNRPASKPAQKPAAKPAAP